MADLRMRLQRRGSALAPLPAWGWTLVLLGVCAPGCDQQRDEPQLRVPAAQRQSSRPVVTSVVMDASQRDRWVADAVAALGQTSLARAPATLRYSHSGQGLDYTDEALSWAVGFWRDIATQSLFADQSAPSTALTATLEIRLSGKAATTSGTASGGGSSTTSDDAADGVPATGTLVLTDANGRRVWQWDIPLRVRVQPMARPAGDRSAERGLTPRGSPGDRVSDGPTSLIHAAEHRDPSLPRDDSPHRGDDAPVLRWQGERGVALSTGPHRRMVEPQSQVGTAAAAKVGAAVAGSGAMFKANVVWRLAATAHQPVRGVVFVTLLDERGRFVAESDRQTVTLRPNQQIEMQASAPGATQYVSTFISR